MIDIEGMQVKITNKVSRDTLATVITMLQEAVCRWIRIYIRFKALTVSLTKGRYGNT